MIRVRMWRMTKGLGGGGRGAGGGGVFRMIGILGEGEE
jgi:hypothetical protein